ncbi:MAG: 50S ribosomal protein L3 [Gammaproteobacteria bacterium]|nr:50S ribosomal protein L3 [Gammaproteobacteria bacterium]
MAIGLVVKKCGMSRLFNDDGRSIPVTILELSPTFVSQIKTSAIDGYSSLQITTGEKKINKVTEPLQGHFKKAGLKPGLGLWEFRVSNDADLDGYKVGDELSLESLFAVGQKVDVTSHSKGKGFAGTVKRHNFRTQDASHGNSRSHRVPGSIGQNQTPGRVFKGKKMAGHLGDVRTTIQSQEIVKLDLGKKLIMVKGGVPGAPGALVILKPAVKAKAGV